MTRMRSANWDAVVTSAPLNKTAGIVRDGRGEKAFVPRKEIYLPNQKHSDLPLPLRTRPSAKEFQKNPEFKDFSGAVMGRMTVIGMAAESGAERARWVVRCVCGVYEHRTTKAIRKALTDPERADRMRCSVCDYTREMIAGRTGIEFPKQTVGK